MRAALFLAIALPGAACMAPSPAPTPTPAPATRTTPARREPADRVVAAGEPFELALGQTAEIRGLGERIRFVSVEEDSRCPEGVQCIVAGKARILLEVSGGGEPATVELGTAGGTADAVQDGQTIRLLELMPHPSSKRSIQPADYRARLVVGNL